jgi:ATP-dependent DNA ligase
MTTATFEEIEQAIKSKTFGPPKPKEEQDDGDKAIIADLESKGELLKMRKDDGNGHTVLSGNKAHHLDIYTLGMNLATEKYPRIIADLKSIKLPKKTIISTEISSEVDGYQDRFTIGALSTSTIATALQAQASGINPEMSFFNTLMWDGEDATKWSNGDRYLCLLDHMKKYKKDHVRIIEVFEGSLEQARKKSRKDERKDKWEGLVLYDMNATTEFTISKNGKKPKIPRPYGIWKDKPCIEIDFVAYGFIPSDAKTRKGALRDLLIGLIDPYTNKIIPCGRCSSGLTLPELIKYAQPGALPVAVEVTMEAWSKHGKHQQGSIVRVRDADEKSYDQCIATDIQLANYLSDQRIDLPWLKK